MEAIVTTTDGFENESSDPIPVVAETPAPETPAVEAVAEEAETEEKPDAASEAGRELAKKKQSLQARIDAITREKHDSIRERDVAKAESARLKQELDALKAPKAAPAAGSTEKFESYDTWSATHADGSYEDYLDERTTFNLDKKLAAQRATEASKEAERTASQTHAAFLTRGREKYPDFDAQLQSLMDAGIQFSEPMSIALVNEPLGPDLLHLLNGDHTEAKKIAGLQHPVAAGVALGKLLAKLETAPPGPVSTPKPLSQAKPVIKPVTTTPPASDPDELTGEEDFDEHNRKMNALDRRKERGR